MPKPRERKLLLTGFSADAADLFRRRIGPDVRVGLLGRDDTISREMIASAGVVLIESSIDLHFARRICQLLNETESSAIVFAVGGDQHLEELRSLLPGIRQLPDISDHAYLRGVLDSSQADQERLKILGAEQNRVQALYEISSALLKVTSRSHIAKALDSTLPGIFEAQVVLLALPTDSNPAVYFRAPDHMTRLTAEALLSHLREAWDVLRPGQRANWEWIRGLAQVTDHPDTPRVSANSFLTTPITRGSLTEGFFTILPLRERVYDEAFLQSFFVVGDLLSVLLYNLHLKEKLEERATTDGLTGLLNRQTLIEDLEKECRRCHRYGQSVAIVMMDLDFFKQINDRFGHQAGDEVLRMVSRRIAGSMRDTDVAGRCGGEEFMVVLPATDAEGARLWAERLRETLAGRPVAHKGREITVTASLGVAAAHGELANAESLIGRADAALYRAKAEGRNRVAIADPLGGSTPVPAVRNPR